MTQEEKELLLQDLCARLPYGLKVCYINLSDEMPKVWDLIGMPAPHLADILVEGSYRFAAVNIEENIRPYLRPMSSMTEEEEKELKEYLDTEEVDCSGFGYSEGGTLYDYISFIPYSICVDVVDWLNKKMFDYRELIPMGLALEAPEGMYNTKTE